MRKTCPALVVLALLACAHRPATAPDAREVGELPLGLVMKVGRAIAEQDQVSADATDVLVEARGKPSALGMRGWITLEDDDAWEVDWIDGDPATPHAICSLHIKGKQVFADCPPQPAALSPSSAAMWRARQTALHSVDRICGSSVNPVVLPAQLIGRKGWLVYLLNPPTKRHSIVLGGHIRVLVSEDGRAVVDVFRLSKSCMEQDMGTNGAAAMVSLVVTELPVETHVSESLRSKYPIFVTSDAGMWKVENGRIWKMSGDDLIEVKE
jgi:hypothetical protein